MAPNILPISINYTNEEIGDCLMEGSVVGEVSGSFDECGGTLTQTWNFTDDCGRPITYSQIIMVEPAPQAVFTNTPSDITISCAEAQSLAPSIINYTNGGISECLIEGSVTGIITGSFDECGGTLTQTWTLTDDCDRTMTYSQIITVEPAPQAVFTNTPSDITISCAEAQGLTPSIINYTNGAIAECIIEGSVTGVITGSFDECGGTLTQTWTLADDCDRTIIYSQIIMVEPAPQAVFTNTPSDITISCEEAQSLAPSIINYTNGGIEECLIEGSVTGIITGSFDECGGTLTQTWTFTDDCDRTINYSQIVTVEPAPQAVFANTPSDITISCAEAQSLTPSIINYTNGAIAECLIEGSVTGIITGSFDECGGTLTQTWTFTDDCDRTINYSQIITVEPAPQAVFTNTPSDITISCAEAQSLTPSIINYTNGAIAECLIEGSVIGYVTGCFDECGGKLTQFWTFTDDCGRTITYSQIITVEPAPQAVFTNTPSDITISCAKAQSLTPSILDYTNGAISECLIEGSVNGIITGSFDECGGTLIQTWTFTDNCGRSISYSQTISVLASQEVIFDIVFDRIISCSEAQNLVPTDLYYTNNETSGCLIEGSVMGSISGSFDECSGTLTQTWTFTDNCGRISNQSQSIKVINDELICNCDSLDSLIIVFEEVSEISISCQEALNFTPTELYYTNNAPGDCLIEGVVMGSISGSYDECGGTLTQSWFFTDDCGKNITQTQTITVEPAPQAIFDFVPNSTISCAEAQTLTASELYYTNNAPGECLIEGVVMGSISESFDECGQTLTQLWTFTDNCGRTTVQTANITILEDAGECNCPPPKFNSEELSSLSNKTISCFEALTYTSTSLSFSNNTEGECLIEGVVEGVISDCFDECGEILQQTWTFTDKCGRTISHIQNIIVEPAPQAVFDNTPPDITISCEDAQSFILSDLNYTNGELATCNIEGTIGGTLLGDFDECGGILQQTWTFIDKCGRTISHIQNITVEPANQAVFINTPSDITISCAEAQSLTPSIINYTNGAISECIIEGSVTGIITGSFDECGGSLTQTWTFTDDCDRTINYSQIITVEPAPQAVFTNTPSDITISCVEAQSLTPSIINYTNEAISECIIEGSVTGVITGSFDECGGSLTQTWTFTDDCSRSLTYSQLITVEPAPQAVFTNTPSDITISCTEAQSLTPSIINYTNGAIAECLIEGSVTGVITGSFDECGGTLTQTWTFIDDCDRTISYSQTISIDPTPQAIFENPPGDITISCDDAPSFVVASLEYSNGETENCSIQGTVSGTLQENLDECGITLLQSWTYSDKCGRTISHIQNITILEEVLDCSCDSPDYPTAEFIDPPQDITLNCEEAMDYIVPDQAYSNGLNGNCEISGEVSGVILGNIDECEGPYLVYWTFTDNCDRMISDTQVIYIQSCVFNLRDDVVSGQVDQTFSIDVLANDNYPLDGLLRLKSFSEDVIGGLKSFPSGQVSGTIEKAFSDTLYIDYEVCSETCNRCEEATLKIYNSAIEDLVLTNVISPNGDGVNDILKFSTQGEIPNSELFIYNRWGNQIFHTKDYQNNWSADGYPGGIYYYVLIVEGAVVKKTLTVLK